MKTYQKLYVLNIIICWIIIFYLVYYGMAPSSHLLVGVGNVRALADRLSDGENPNKKAGMYSLLYYGIVNNEIDCTDLLLKYGADPNDTIGGTSLLDLAIMEKNADIVRLLVNHGANINENIEDSWSAPLFLAISSGNPEIVEILLENGADVMAKDVDGVSALDYSKRFPDLHNIFDKYSGK